ncbi:MAG: SPOR domain-containing protein [Nonlabens sp.]|nr:SPOR domain-containing protein [Nonlabens sp.]
MTCILPSNAQNTGPIDPVRLDSLVATRLDMPKPGRVTGNYMIQLFYGDKVAAERVKSQYDAKQMQWESIMRYEQPFHKVWIGKFRSKAEAERVMFELRKDYPKALVLLPKS